MAGIIHVTYIIICTSDACTHRHEMQRAAVQRAVVSHVRTAVSRNCVWMRWLSDNPKSTVSQHCFIIAVMGIQPAGCTNDHIETTAVAVSTRSHTSLFESRNDWHSLQERR